MGSSFRFNPVSRALLFILAVTVWRVVLLAFNGTDLFVDEAQYWFWGQELAFGYYSKPPMIGWIIRAVTELSGNDSEFWVRLPAPLFHALTAILIIAVTLRIRTPLAAAVAGAAYITLPVVSLGSQFIATDTIMLPFFTLALLAFVVLSQRRSLFWAIVMGLAIGLGLMSKYAMIYFVGCAALTAVLFPAMRMSWRDCLSAALVAFAVISPNILWNLNNDLTTFQHIADNAKWNGIQFNLTGFVEFFGGQFGVFGPILFASYLWICYLTLSRRSDQWSAILVAVSLPVLFIVTGQSILSRAYANWAVATYIGATILTVPWLLENYGRLLKISFGLHIAIAILLPAASAVPYYIGYGDRLAFARVLGRAENSEKIVAITLDAGLKTIVAGHRGVLADLFYRLKGSGLSVYAAPGSGRARNHYQLKHPYPSGLEDTFLFVTRNPSGPACGNNTDFRELARWTPERGVYRGKTHYAFEVMPGCWQDRD